MFTKCGLYYATFTFPEPAGPMTTCPKYRPWFMIYIFPQFYLLLIGDRKSIVLLTSTKKNKLKIKNTVELIKE